MRFIRPAILITVLLLALLPTGGCESDEDNENFVLRYEPIEASAGYNQRRQAYLDYCIENNAPGSRDGGGFHGQVCRVYSGETTYITEEITNNIAKINAREDTSDFALNSMLRMLYFDRRTHSLPDDLRQQMEQMVLDFKYWLDEPGPDTMCWWSENHQALFHTAEVLAGQLFPDEVFTNSGMTGREHIEHGMAQINRWLDMRGRFGFSEWHSNVYFNEDMPPLINLVDFAEDESVRIKAAMVLDTIAFDMASNYFAGRYATTHGRTYPSKFIGEKGLNDSTAEAAYIMLGLLAPDEELTDLGQDNFTAAFLATSEHYNPPPILEEIAAAAKDNFEHKQHDGITIEEGPDYGIGYTDDDDIVFWWGMTGYVAPQIIEGTFEMIEKHSMWGGFTWRDLWFLRLFYDSPLLESVSEDFKVLSRGVTLDAVDTYTYRTPHYQLSGAQDYKPGYWGAQMHIWQATLTPQAYVMTTYPGGLGSDYMGGSWTGGFLPRATLYKNVGVIQYIRIPVPELDDFLFEDYSHAYFPRGVFDDYVLTDHWAIGREGDAYVALYSQNAVTASTENDYELIANAKENVWIVELGDADNNGTFEDFADSILAANVEIGERVNYQSPSVGAVSVGREGPMTVAGQPADTGPYLRWDNPYCTQRFGSMHTQIEFEGRMLDLDFAHGRRRMQ